MAKDKERSVNPAAQQRKVEKNKALKKAKAEKQSQRNERLAHRNPDRIQRQIDDLKALESSSEIKPREKTILVDLERDLKAIYKAKESLGDKTPVNATRERPQQDRNRKDGNYSRPDNKNANFTVLGKRRHDGQRKHYDEPSSSSETDESVRNIPMPRDTPPPTPRARVPYNSNKNTNQTLSAEPHALPARPPAQPTIQAKTTYSSAPQIRDLKKEATSRFVPTAVKIKQDAIKGVGSTLLEPEEFDKLEQAGYIKPSHAKEKKTSLSTSLPTAAVIASQPLEGYGINNEEDNEEARRLAEEEARFEKELGLDLDQKDTEMDVNIDTDKIGIRDELSDAESEENDAASSSVPPLRNNTGGGGGGGGGLFSSLPRPTAANYNKRRVEIEEVVDEDL